ncbi:peptidoglycan DD-metalloendopeptidase family protein [Shewanella sp. A32]|uniref:peptidoglycan DD-metalloendopeptidase family protein n=1 Tax=Shewanella sp. A32 TaxID=3031327 RepID=UPI0023B89A1A|nr:peptidoglycan DD-metalloendopeptidase family protein [Shewanella sp. A32]MDF0534550.1 peptidoglycan DD-metalloendopeptidase family protein [Shewanella sp. A32]
MCRRLCYGVVIVAAILSVSACSFQSYHPAPVYSVSGSRPIIAKGYLNSAKTYKVNKGDTLYSIAWAADKDYQELAKINRLDSAYTIYPGQILHLNPISSNKKAHNLSNYSKRKNEKYGEKINKKQNDKLKNATVQSVRPASQKTLDSDHKSAYSVTTSKQDVNGIIHSSGAILPDEVGQWLWPANGNVVATFSSTEQGNRGIKIAGNRGDIIKAAADGRVVYAGNALRGYGNLVIIKHSDDYLSAYAHTDKILVKEQQNVSAGQTIATMGSTGTDQVMLHFEIRYHGQSVNPLKYLPKR